MVERPPATDEDLMWLVQTGGRSELSALMRRYANSLLTFLRRMTGSHHRSEELFQEAFLIIWQRRKDFQLSRSFRAWLFGIAANLCRSSGRAEGRQPELLAGEQISFVAGTTNSPLDSAVATETSQVVEQAVLRLSDLQRQVLVLRIWNGLSYQAIGQILDREEATVRSHMHHALHALRKHLASYWREANL